MSKARLDDLTFREREVLRRICAGESDRQIAEGLGIAHTTARTHARSVLLKLGVGTRAAAAALIAPRAAPPPLPPLSISSPLPPPSPRALTMREAEILRCCAAGLTQPAIARRLVLSPHTVRTHVRNLLAKLGLHSVHAAAALVRQAP
ncbi:MAG TPA: helix-turn-helix transcriptional regulator [Actinocrinis sp.]|jgi:DNA-binding NarL/FixJ family response regulator